MNGNNNPEGKICIAPIICFIVNFVISFLIFMFGYREHLYGGGPFAAYAVVRFYAWCIIIVGMYQEERKFIKNIAIFSIFEVSLIYTIHHLMIEKRNSRA